MSSCTVVDERPRVYTYEMNYLLSNFTVSSPPKTSCQKKCGRNVKRGFRLRVLEVVYDMDGLGRDSPLIRSR